MTEVCELKSGLGPMVALLLIPTGSLCFAAASVAYLMASRKVAGAALGLAKASGITIALWGLIALILYLLFSYLGDVLDAGSLLDGLFFFANGLLPVVILAIGLRSWVPLRSPYGFLASAAISVAAYFCVFFGVGQVVGFYCYGALAT